MLKTELSIAVDDKSRQFGGPFSDFCRFTTEPLKSALSDITLSGKLRAEHFPAVLRSVFKNQVPHSLRKGIEYEDEYAPIISSLPTSIHQILRESGVPEERFDDIHALSQLAVPSNVMEIIEARFIEKPKLFEELAGLGEVPTRGARGRLRSFLKETARMVSEWEAGSIKLEPIFEHIKGARGVPDLTVHFDKPGSLYFITHLPRIVRYAVQDMILANNSIDYLENGIGTGNPAYRHHELLREYFIHSCFNNSHWSQLLQFSKASDQVVLEIGRQNRIQESAAFKIAKDADFKAVYEVLCNFTSHRKEEIAAHSGNLKGSSLQTIDIGHCFGNSPIYSGIFGQGRFDGPKLDKDGRHAVIFEDDPAQQVSYREIINHLSPAIVPQESGYVTDSPAQVLELASKHPSIGIFLLDISQPKDSHIGIKLAKQLALDLLKLYPPYEADKMPGYGIKMVGGQARTKLIVVWSSSVALKQEAAEILKIWGQENPNLISGIEIPGHSMSGKQRIKFKILMKSEVDFWL